VPAKKNFAVITRMIKA